MWKNTCLTVSAIVLLLAPRGAAQDTGGQGQPAAPASTTRPVDRMAWWREARFGLFIHWGLYAIPAGQWRGETNHAEWIRHTARIPRDEYDRLRERFNPVRFDAEAWVRLAKEAGMRYIVITTKHHDGFCLFDSAWTDHDVMSTPFRRDIMRELSDACRRHGLKIGWYHSIMDWHHPDYLPRRDWEADSRPTEGAVFSRYVEYLQRQVEELLTRYGDVGVMWFDGEWEETWTHEHGLALYALCRRLQPDVIINNRVDKGRAGMAGLTTDVRFAGDFGTPEQEVPATGLPGVDWESCLTMNRHWGYNQHDDDWKSSEQLIRTLVDIASKGGNLLLNVGPMSDGSFPPPSAQRLREIGAWMRVNGESIHGTTGGPLHTLSWGRCTQRQLDDGQTRLYLHVFAWPSDGELVLPGLGNAAGGAFLLSDPNRRPLFVSRRQDALVIQVPPQAPDRVDSVVAVDVVGRVEVTNPATRPAGEGASTQAGPVE